jgi:hypothetical protein
MKFTHPKRNSIYVGIAALSILILACTCSLPLLGQLTGADQSGEVTGKGPTLTINPSKGPTGTSATIQLTGALPNAPVTLDLDPGSTSGTTDAKGNWTYTHTFNGQVGDKSNVKATIGAANEQSASATFEITGATAGDEEIADAISLMTGELSVSVDPNKGPSGTTATITVSGAGPGEPVTLQIGEATTSGTTDANGNFTYEFTFYGQVGDVITIEATVGTSSDSPKVSTTFTITGELEQVYQASATVGSDEAIHDPFIQMLRFFELLARSGSVVFEGPPPWVTVTGEIGSDGSFQAEGVGTVAGFPGIAVTFEGTISMENLEGEYVMGANGGLPEGKTITYLIEGVGAQAEPDPELGLDFDEIVAFFTTFNNAQADGDSETMFSMLHPATLELYGAPACQAYLSGIVNPSVVIEPIDAYALESWLWVMDGDSTMIQTAYSVDVKISVNDEETQQMVHLARRPDGTLGWFTDCGDPK